MSESLSESWSLANGNRHVRGWLPSSDPQCALIIVHGLGDYSGRFDVPASWLRDQGAAVYAFDQVGHGQSPGRRMCIPSYEYLLDDLQAVAAEVLRRHPQIPLGLFGQSMGGNLILNYALRHRPHVEFAIAGSPMLRSETEPGPVANMLARGLMKVTPNLCVSTPVNVTQLARNPAVQQRFVEDMMVQHKVSLRLGAALIDSGKWALKNAHRLPYQVLLMHGDRDKITSPVASREFANSAVGKVDLRIWEGGLHDLHLDDGHEEYLAAMWNWIDHRMGEGQVV